MWFALYPCCVIFSCIVLSCIVLSCIVLSWCVACVSWHDVAVVVCLFVLRETCCFVFYFLLRCVYCCGLINIVFSYSVSLLCFIIAVFLIEFVLLFFYTNNLDHAGRSQLNKTQCISISWKSPNSIIYKQFKSSEN